MFIQIEETPNPSTLKFHPGSVILQDRVLDITDAEKADLLSPLASALFLIEGVSGVFLGYDFISVSKKEALDWQILKPAILGVIMEHLTAGRPILNSAQEVKDDHQNSDHRPEDQPIIDKIIELLDSRVRPAVAQDGGDIVFHGFDKGIVYLAMRGACAGCPSSTATLKMGVENMLRHYIPEIVEVRAYSD